MKYIKRFFLISFLLGLCAGSFWYFSDIKVIPVSEDQLKQALLVAKGLLNRSHPIKAIHVLKEMQDEIQNYPYLNEEWNQLLVQAAKEINNDDLIHTLYLQKPSLFKEDEELSLRLATSSLLKGNFALYEHLGSLWKTRTLTPNQWLLLEADALAYQGESDKAKELLTSKHLIGEEEVSRLVRLALLNENEHPKVAWEYLSKALKLSPNSSELHYFRAKLLENTEHQDLATLELKESIQNDPDNPFFKEELVDYYLNKHNLGQAYEVLNHSLNPPSTDKLWLQALFLNLIYRPIQADIYQLPLPEGPLTPFLRYLMVLEPKQLWNSMLLHSQPKVVELIQQIPEAYWIETIADLKNGAEANAFSQLVKHPEMGDLYPDLYNSLQIVIANKLSHLDLKTSLQDFSLQKSKHPLFKQLQSQPYPPEIEKLVLSKEIYSALFLAAGWYEAALTLHQMQQIPADYPKWLAYGLTKAIALNRNDQQALIFAKSQNATPQLNLLMGELALKTHQYEFAHKVLTPLAISPTEVGAEAAAHLAKLYFQESNYPKVRDTIYKNKRYFQSLEGQELLAKVSLKEGDYLGAEKIYTQLKDRSSEAKSFFATKAFQNEDYTLAYKLTQELLNQYPNRKDLKDQMTQILRKLKNTNITKNN